MFCCLKCLCGCVSLPTAESKQKKKKKKKKKKKLMLDATFPLRNSLTRGARTPLFSWILELISWTRRLISSRVSAFWSSTAPLRLDTWGGGGIRSESYRREKKPKINSRLSENWQFMNIKSGKVIENHRVVVDNDGWYFLCWYHVLLSPPTSSSWFSASLKPSTPRWRSRDATKSSMSPSRRRSVCSVKFSTPISPRISDSSFLNRYVCQKRRHIDEYDNQYR